MSQTTQKTTDSRQGEMPPRRVWIEQHAGDLHAFQYRQSNDSVEYVRADLSRAPLAAVGCDDGSADWCDDCHGYTHKYDCPSKRQEVKTPLVDKIVNAVYRSMAQYEDGTWFLDNLKAKARVNKLLAAAASSAPAEPPQNIFNEDSCMFCGGKTAHESDCSHGRLTRFRVGDRLRNIHASYLPIATVTELTPSGFKYELERPLVISPRLGTQVGGESYDDSQWEPITAPAEPEGEQENDKFYCENCERDFTESPHATDDGCWLCHPCWEGLQ